MFQNSDVKRHLKQLMLRNGLCIYDEPSFKKEFTAFKTRKYKL